MIINFVTTNSYKFESAKATIDQLSNNTIEVVQYDLETPEIQSERVESIASHSAVWVSKQLGQMAVSSDLGLSIRALNGFPGPFVKYVNSWLSPNDILNLMDGKIDRSAQFIEALACADPQGNVQTFSSITSGRIIDVKSLPDTKWTMDAVFIPDNLDKTLIEMSDEEKEHVWDESAWGGLLSYLNQKDKK